MDTTDHDRAQIEELPAGYVEKSDGTVAPDDLIWSTSDNAFLPVQEDDDLIGTSVDDVQRVATSAYWVTFDSTTGIVWGVGESPEESLRAAKFEAFGDEHGAVGYEFACWCEEMSTKMCSETLYAKANESGHLSISDDRLEEHIAIS